MNARIKKARQTLGLTQQEFADKLDLSRNYIALIEMGRRDPGDRTVRDICRLFDVSELWLRTGEGEMFPPRNRLDELSYLAGRFLNSQPTEFQQRFALMMYALTEEEWALLEKKARFLLGQDGKAE